MTGLVVRLPNWVGDVCMALPTLQALSAAGFTCSLIGRAWARDLLAAGPWPILDAGRGIRAGRAAVQASGCRQGLLLTNSLGTALTMRLAGVAAIGHRGDWRRLLLHRHQARDPRCHEVEAFWRLGELARAAFRPAASWPSAPPERLRLPLASEQHELAASRLAEAGITGPFILLCPLATGTIAGQSKIWPHWPQCCRQLAACGLPLVTCPGPNETLQARAACPEATVLSDCRLGTYAAIASRARLVLANDSGPMHLATAAGAGPRTLGLFGVSDPGRTRPWGADHLGSSAGWPSPSQVLHWVDERLAAGDEH